VADGETIESALHEAEDALKSWLLTAKKSGDEIPKPSITDRFSGQWRIRLPKSLHASLTLRAKQEGVSLNTLAAILLAQSMGENIRPKHKLHKKL
jgi:antitoxin HicB